MASSPHTTKPAGKLHPLPTSWHLQTARDRGATQQSCGLEMKLQCNLECPEQPHQGCKVYGVTDRGDTEKGYEFKKVVCLLFNTDFLLAYRNFPWYKDPGLQLSFILRPKEYHVTVPSLLVFKGLYVVQIVNLCSSTLKWCLQLMRFRDMSCVHTVSVYSGRRGLCLTFRNVSFLQAKKKSLLQKYLVAKKPMCTYFLIFHCRISGY